MLRKYVYSAPTTINPTDWRGFPLRLLQYLQVELHKIALAFAGVVEAVGAIHEVPAGGTADQLLAKVSATDHDLAWVDPPSGGSASYWNRLAANRTMPNDLNFNPIFGASEDTLTLPAGTYVFDALLALTGMSGTTGNGRFDLLGAGTATIGVVTWSNYGVDSAAGLTALAALNGQGSVSTNGATNTNLNTAATSTGMRSTLRGIFTVTAAGTIIPSFRLTTAIATATMQEGTYFACQRLGDAAAVSAGWS